MIKSFCDLCEEEIKDVQLISEFRMREKAFEFIKHQKTDGIRERYYIFCPGCAVKMNQKREEMKKEIKFGNK